MQGPGSIQPRLPGHVPLNSVLNGPRQVYSETTSRITRVHQDDWFRNACAPYDATPITHHSQPVRAGGDEITVCDTHVYPSTDAETLAHENRRSFLRILSSVPDHRTRAVRRVRVKPAGGKLIIFVLIGGVSQIIISQVYLPTCNRGRSRRS
jgi:hypothetical protein